jgi:hypothetical protein
MRIIVIIILALGSACEFSGDKRINYKLDSQDSIIYELVADDCLLTVYQQRIKADKASTMHVMVYTPDRSKLMENTKLTLTVINKGRRKRIDEIKTEAPGVYKAIIHLGFNGPSTLEFEVTTDRFKNSIMIDHEIID